MKAQPSDEIRLSFSATVEQAVKKVESNLFDMLDDLYHYFAGYPLSENLRQEIEQYFTTGNCDGSRKENAACPNPTFLEPVTGQWHAHYTACPFSGYFPLPLQEVEEKAHDNKGRILSFCQFELKKLLVDFRKRIRDVKFSFHVCDGLEFCYLDSPLNFDIIDASDLGDVVGLVNVLNAATQKLRSDQSVLVTETVQWNKVPPKLSQYIQEVLCCPLSLIPTIYGLRLVDHFELGPETPLNINAMKLRRFRWKTTLPFEGVSLVLSQSLKRSLKKLRDECFRLSPSSVFISKNTGVRCGMFCYSPLTFHYVVGDMIRRGGFRDPTALMPSALSRLPPVFGQSLETTQAWMTHRPVWWVTICTPFHQVAEPAAFYNFVSYCNPILRLVLIPFGEHFSDSNSGSFSLSSAREIDWLGSTRLHSSTI